MIWAPCSTTEFKHVLLTKSRTFFCRLSQNQELPMASSSVVRLAWQSKLPCCGKRYQKKQKSCECRPGPLLSWRHRWNSRALLRGILQPASSPRRSAWDCLRGCFMGFITDAVSIWVAPHQDLYNLGLDILVLHSYHPQICPVSDPVRNAEFWASSWENDRILWDAALWFISKRWNIQVPVWSGGPKTAVENYMCRTAHVNECLEACLLVWLQVDIGTRKVHKNLTAEIYHKYTRHAESGSSNGHCLWSIWSPPHACKLCALSVDKLRRPVMNQLGQADNEAHIWSWHRRQRLQTLSFVVFWGTDMEGSIELESCEPDAVLPEVHMNVLRRVSCHGHSRKHPPPWPVLIDLRYSTTYNAAYCRQDSIQWDKGCNKLILDYPWPWFHWHDSLQRLPL